VLIVAAGSTLQHVTDLRGQVVAFGPPDDSLTHHAALQLLQAAGLAPTDLALEALPVPGSLKHFPNTRATAQSVINGSSQAGFVPEADWAALPAQDAREGEPARGKLRVIAETTALPARLIVASVKMDDATAQRVREALVSMGARRPAALEPLEIAGYTTPGADVLAACRALQVAKPGAAPAETAEAGDTKHN
jgi:ABC-type phosphate/phosphonate transport system substrate-binding protein